MTHAEAAIRAQPRRPEAQEASGPLLLHGRALAAARVALGIYAIVAITAFALFNYYPYQGEMEEDQALWPTNDVVSQGLSDLGLPQELPAWWASGAVALTAVVSFAMAGILVWRRSRQAIAFLVAAFLIGASVAIYPPYLTEVAEDRPFVAFIGALATFPFPAGLMTLAFIFPDGRFTPRLAAIPVAVFLGILVWSFFPTPREGTVGGGWVDAVMLVSLLAGAIASQVYRYRTTVNATVRRQLRLFGIGFGLFLSFFVAVNIVLAVADLDRPDFPPVPGAVLALTMGTAFGFATLLLNVLLAASILRDRLFDIEVVLNRSIVFVALTATVAALYAAIVAGSAVLFDVNANGLIAVIGAAAVAIAVQPLRVRLQRGANRLLYGQRDEPYSVLAGLSRRLHANLPPEAIVPEVVAAITTALKLPYAIITAARDGRVAGESGAPAPLDLRIPLVHQGELVGELGLAAWPGTPLETRDRALIEDLAAQAAAAMHAAQLRDDLLQSRLRLVTMQEEERRRIRRDLHDGLGPKLAGMMLRVDTIRDQLPAGSSAGPLLDDLADRMGDSVAAVRQVVYGLRPPALDDLGLVGALRQACDQPSPPLVRLDAPEQLPPLPAAVEVAAYHIALEALTNAVRHAGGTECNIAIASGSDPDLVVRVADNGRGLPATFTAGVGLRSMRERAEELGGTLVIESEPGSGTAIIATLPLLAGVQP